MQPDVDHIPNAKQRRLILIAMCTALVAVVASVSGLNVAQQQLATELGASQSQLLWVINGYTIALAALLMPIGAIGDRWGRKHVLVGGLALFVGSNVVAAISTTVTQLLLSRVAAGVGAAMIMPVTLSVITSSFPAEDRDRAVGVWAGFAGAGGILGLITSSIVVDNFTWPWVFAAPVLMAAIAFAMTLRSVPNSREHNGGRFDTVGSVLSAVAVGACPGITKVPSTADRAVDAHRPHRRRRRRHRLVVWELRQTHPLLNIGSSATARCLGVAQPHGRVRHHECAIPRARGSCGGARLPPDRRSASFRWRCSCRLVGGALISRRVGVTRHVRRRHFPDRFRLGLIAGLRASAAGTSRSCPA